jgi:exosortase
MINSGKIESGPSVLGSRVKWFLMASLALLIPFRGILSRAAFLAFGDERYTYIAFVPLVSVLLTWMRRERLGSVRPATSWLGLPLVLGGVTLAFLSGTWVGGSDQLSVAVGGMLLTWIGLGALFLGFDSLRAASFPLIFLVLAIPIPGAVLDLAVTSLQRASATMTAVVFKMIGMPFLKNGYIFSLPGIDIEVAKECSGIRSSIAFVLGSIVVGYLCLRLGWSRLLLVALTIPIVILKNAIRIVTIAWLGVYVDRGYFFGDLHRYGGFPFSMMAIALIAGALCLLARLERAPVRPV